MFFIIFAALKKADETTVLYFFSVDGIKILQPGFYDAGYKK